MLSFVWTPTHDEDDVILFGHGINGTDDAYFTICVFFSEKLHQ